MVKFLAILIWVGILQGQTATYTYGSGCGGGGCSASYYSAVGGTHATNPVLVFVSGGGWTSIAAACPHVASNPTMCFDVTDWTRHGYEAYLPSYTLNAGHIWPTMGQDLACFLSDAVTNSRNGNWNNVLLAGVSAGGQIAGVIAMGPVGKYLTDGNANCPSSNTSWRITGLRCNSCIVDMTNNANGYNTIAPSTCTSLFGGAVAGGGTPAALALDASMTHYIASWEAKGSPRIVMTTGSLDTAATPGNQSLLVTAVQSAGYGSSIMQIQVVGYKHGLDAGSNYYTGETWPEDLTNTAAMSAPNCTFLGTSNPLCGPLGYVGRAFDLFLPSSSGSSGGSSGAGWSW